MRHNGYDSSAPQRTPNGCLTSMGYGSVRDGGASPGQRPSTLDENDEMSSLIFFPFILFPFVLSNIDAFMWH